MRILNLEDYYHIQKLNLAIYFSYFFVLIFPPFPPNIHYNSIFSTRFTRFTLILSISFGVSNICYFYTVLYYLCFCTSFVLEALIVLTLINRLLTSITRFKKLGQEHLNPLNTGVNKYLLRNILITVFRNKFVYCLLDDDCKI